MATLLVASLEETLSMTAFGDADPFRGRIVVHPESETRRAKKIGDTQRS
jgi:hypothetical protein